MSTKSKLIIQGCIPIILLLVLFAGFAACRHSSSPSGETYTVMFDTVGGIPVPEPMVVPAGSKIDAPKGVTKTKNDLSGWYTDLDYEKEWIFEDYIVTGDMTLYARWGTTRSGGSSSRSGGPIPGTSNYSQTVHYYQEADMDGHVALIDIKFTHTSGTLGPDPKEGDTYTITLNDGGNHVLSTGTVKDLGQDADGYEIYVFIPSDGEYPFMGDFKEGVLSVDYIHDMNGHYDDISVSGAVLKDDIEADIPDHTHTGIEIDELDDFIHNDTIHHLAHSFDAVSTSFDNSDSSNHSILGKWVTKYTAGYYGWETTDMPVVKATAISDPYGGPTEKGKVIHGTWQTGTSTLVPEMHVAIKESQATLLQFKGGGQPYTLELDDDYGLGSPVGTITITASGQTNIVTLRLDLNSGYKMDPGVTGVKWLSSTAPASLPNPLPIPEVGKVYAYAGVPSNTKFEGAVFAISSTNSTNREHIFAPDPVGRHIFVSVDDHNGASSTVVVDDPAYNETVHKKSYYDPSPGMFTSTWIFERCNDYGDEYYRIGSSDPYKYITESQIIRYGGSCYEIDELSGTETFYYDYINDKYYKASDVGAFLNDPKGPSFNLDSFGPDILFKHDENILVHAAKTFDLEMVDALSAVHKVGKVHVEYNRYEPHYDKSAPLPHEVKIPYTLTITYYFDNEFQAIMGTSWDCIPTNVTVKVNGSPIIPLDIKRTGDEHTIIAEEILTDGVERKDINVTLDFDTEFDF